VCLVLEGASLQNTLLFGGSKMLTIASISLCKNTLPFGGGRGKVPLGNVPFEFTRYS